MTPDQDDQQEIVRELVSEWQRRLDGTGVAENRSPEKPVGPKKGRPANPADFVVTIHALDRLEQRFPSLIQEIDGEDADEEEDPDLELLRQIKLEGRRQAELERQARVIFKEVTEGIDHGRYGGVPPIELASRNAYRWLTRTPGSYFVWTENKLRGYLVKEDGEEGMLVLTVLLGTPREEAMGKIHKKSLRFI